MGAGEIPPPMPGPAETGKKEVKMRNTILEVSPNIVPYEHVLDVAIAGAVPATATSRNNELRIDEDAYFVVEYFKASFTGRFNTMIRDSRGYYYMNIPIENVCMWGAAGGATGQPFILPFPIVVDPNTALYFDFVDLSGATNTLQLVLGGHKHFDKARPPRIGLGPGKYTRDHWFGYAIDVTLTANEDRNFPLKTDRGSDFIIKNFRHYTSSVVNDGFRTIMADSIRRWSRNFVNRSNQWGDAQYPYELPRPQLISPDTNITARVADLTTAGLSAQLLLDGMKVY
jgi:hypothetical protein